MSDQTNVSLKFGGGYDAPWLTVYGTPAEIKAQLIEATGLDPDYANALTLAEVIVESSRWARGIFTAAEKLGEKPKVRVTEASEEKATDAKPKSKGGLAAQAKAAKAEPEDVTNSIESLIANAITEDALHDLFTKFDKNGWEDQHTELAAARVAEIRGEDAA